MIPWSNLFNYKSKKLQLIKIWTYRVFGLDLIEFIREENRINLTYFPKASISVVILSSSLIAEKSLLVDSNLTEDKSSKSWMLLIPNRYKPMLELAFLSDVEQSKWI